MSVVAPFPFSYWGGADATRFKTAAGNGFLARGADLTGNADSKLLLFSFWFNPVNEDNAATIYGTSRDPATPPASAANAIQWPISGPILFTIRSLFRASDTSTVLQVRTSTQVRDVDGWQHLMGSFDMADIAKRHHFLNDVSDAVYLNYVNNTIDFTRNDHGIGALPDVPALGDFCLAEVYLNFGTFMDLSVEANRRKFITAGLKPADLGADGSTPTGSPPIVYLRGGAADFPTNRGSGGGFTVTSGTVSDCSTSP